MSKRKYGRIKLKNLRNGKMLNNKSLIILEDDGKYICGA